MDEGMAAALAHDGPVMVDAVVNRTELAVPPSITLEMAKGFTIYMVQALKSLAVVPRRREGIFLDWPKFT
jgi:pyruvate dehydrogenase (quinone)